MLILRMDGNLVDLCSLYLASSDIASHIGWLSKRVSVSLNFLHRTNISFLDYNGEETPAGVLPGSSTYILSSVALTEYRRLMLYDAIAHILVSCLPSNIFDSEISLSGEERGGEDMRKSRGEERRGAPMTSPLPSPPSHHHHDGSSPIVGGPISAVGADAWKANVMSETQKSAHSSPVIVWFDVMGNFRASELARCIREKLLRRPITGSVKPREAQLREQVKACLSKVSVVTVRTLADLVAAIPCPDSDPASSIPASPALLIIDDLSALTFQDKAWRYAHESGNMLRKRLHERVSNLLELKQTAVYFSDTEWFADKTEDDEHSGRPRTVEAMRRQLISSGAAVTSHEHDMLGGYNSPYKLCWLEPSLSSAHAGASVGVYAAMLSGHFSDTRHSVWTLPEWLE